MYRVAICDDTESNITYMKEMIIRAGIPANELECLEYGSGEELFDDIEELNNVDLLILDMVLPGMNGCEAAKKFREYFSDTVLVFCSATCPPSMESFETEPYRYILKPVDEGYLLKTLKDVFEKIEKERKACEIIGCYRTGTIKLKPKDIIYVSKGRGYSELHVLSEKRRTIGWDKIIVKQNLDEMYEKLSEYGFGYAHNSYIVNLKYVIESERSQLKLSTGEILTISRSRKDSFLEKYFEYYQN
ncbi:MAG: response regulator transcription factor [Lachnospiraceae bacterium]|nr:response regulator transcription factor [Lachnospiraceae bacterium]